MLVSTQHCCVDHAFGMGGGGGGGGGSGGGIGGQLLVNCSLVPEPSGSVREAVFDNVILPLEHPLLIVCK